MLTLQELEPPTNAVMETEDHVVAHWESRCLGQGTLYLAERELLWISPGTKKGFRLPIPSVVVHAASGANEDFPEPCLFLMIDYSKTDIEYVPTESDDIDEEDNEEIEVKTASVRLVPSNALRISDLFSTLNKCQEMNPELEEQMSDDSLFGDGDCDGEGELAQNGSSGHIHDEDDPSAAEVHEWFSMDNRSDEVRLSAEGRANLERIVGSLNDAPDTSDENASPDQKPTDQEQMEEN
uniref:Methylosome subunit pICln n=1 Tax=Globodera rostochiensis TaxID=31243 RepID=A0A914GNZ4_GLORO